MARRRGLRRHLTRNRSIALVIAIVAFGVVGISGADLGFDIAQGKFYEGTEFSVTIFDNIIPLQFAQNFALSCDMWTEARLVFTDGTTRDLGQSMNSFTESAFIPLSVVDPVSQKTVRSIDGDIRARCQSPINLDVLRIDSGTVDHFVTVEKRESGGVGGVSKTLGFATQSLSSGANLQTTSSNGVLLKTFSFNADLINDALGINLEDYFVNPTLLTQVEMRVTAVTGGVSDTKRVIVGLGSWFDLVLKIQNENFDPNADVIGEPIIITQHENALRGGQGFKLDDLRQHLVLQAQLPNYDPSLDTIPQWKIQRADSNTGLAIGSNLGSGSIEQQLQLNEWGEVICLTDKECSQGQKRTGSNLVEGVYATTAFSTARQSEDVGFFVVLNDDQSATIPIPVDDPTLGDPCEGFTGSELEQCEIARALTLSCDGGFQKVSKVFFDTVASTPGVIVQTQPGIPINEFTVDVCLAQQTIDIFNGLGGGMCTDPNTIFDDATGTCVCGISLDADGNCTGDGGEIGVASANSWLLYEIVYGGANDVGSIRTAPAIIFSVPEALSLLGGTSESTTLFPLSRIHVTPVITTSEIPEAFGNPRSGIFTYTFSGEVTRSGDEADVGSTPVGILEECIPTNFFKTVDGVQVRNDRQNISPSTSCKIFDMNTVSIVTTGDRLGLNVEKDVETTEFYQIARSDIRLEQIEAALEAKSIILNDGDKFKLKVEIAGDFLIGTLGTATAPLRLGVVTPMEWEHEFTFTPVGSDDPCEGKTGDALEVCLRPVTGVASNCLAGESNLDCWNRNHPPKPKTNANDPDCRAVFIAGQLLTICDDDPTAVKKPGLTGDPEDPPAGNPGTTGIANCPEGSTATECADIILKILEQRLSNILGLGGSTITTLSNNAVLIIGAIIAILVVAVIGRALIKRRY